MGANPITECSSPELAPYYFSIPNRAQYNTRSIPTLQAATSFQHK